MRRGSVLPLFLASCFACTDGGAEPVGGTGTGEIAEPGGETTPDDRARPPRPSPTCDAGDWAWAARTLTLLQGRRPEGSAELRLLTDAVAQLDAAGLDGREIVARGLAEGKHYYRRWEHFFYAQAHVNRIDARLNLACYAVGSEAGDSADLAAFVRDHAATDPPFEATGVAPPTMQDLLRSSLRLDDLRPWYRAELWARMARANTGANVGVTELDVLRRTQYGELFESGYLGRDTECLQCHNSEFAVTYVPVDPALNRHWAIPGLFERAIWGASDGRPLDELHAVFRHEGFVGRGDFRPWGLSAGCGLFAADRGGDVVGTSAYLAGELPPGATVADLEPKLRAGMDRVVNPGLSIGDDESVDPDEAMAYLLGVEVANAVWAEATGHRLTLSHGFARNAEQRELLQDLAETFIDSGYAPRELLVEVVTHPWFNLDAPATCGAAYPLPPIHAPFSPEEEDPTARGNGLGDQVHRLSGWVLLDTVAQTMWWDRPQRFGFGPNPRPARLELLEALGVFVKDARPGGKSLDVQSLLAWEEATALGVDPGLSGDCAGPLLGACPQEGDYVDALIDEARLRDATVRDVFATLTDRIHVADLGSARELELLAQLGGLDPDRPVVDADPGALQQGTRRVAGVLLNAPQFMLEAVPRTPPAAPAPLTVPGTDSESLCLALAPTIAAAVGDRSRGYRCDEGQLRISLGPTP